MERKAEEGKRAEWGEREREGGREERGRRRGAFSINSFARKRLFLPMIYGFAIDGSLSLSLCTDRSSSVLERVVNQSRRRTCALCTRMHRCEGKYEYVPERAQYSSKAESRGTFRLNDLGNFIRKSFPFTLN